MSQNRDDLPWFPLYASNIISDKRYRQMAPTEIALWIAMLLECWSNGSVPSDPIALAKWLSWSAEDIKAGFTDRVRTFFEEVNGELISPQLEKHYQKQRGTKKGKSDGGKEGAKRRWKKSNEDKGNQIGNPLGVPSSNQIGNPMGSLNTIKSNTLNSNSVFMKEKVDDSFIKDMEAEEQRIKTSSRVKERI